MCVALPGRVVEIEGTTAVVDFQGNRVRRLYIAGAFGRRRKAAHRAF